MRVAIVGCGYVADSYMTTLPSHPQLEVAGVFDTDPVRVDRFSQHWSVSSYPSLEEMLSDADIDLIINLTNPRSHYDITRSALLANKHVYTEKPLAMNYNQAEELVELAGVRGLRLSGAPCSLLGESAQTMWHALRSGLIGRPKLAYANLDDGMVHLQRPAENWVSEGGAHWPAKDEFEVGCTFEHAGYFLSWLIAMCGSATKVSAFAASLIADKLVPVDVITPDFSVGVVEFESDVVARITCSIVGPIDRSLTLVGEKGILYTKEGWDYSSKVYFRPWRQARWRRGIRRYAGFQIDERVTMVRKPRIRRSASGFPMDFSRGVASLADDVANGRPATLPAELALHITEITEALQHPERFGGSKRLKSSVRALTPMDWAR